MTTTAVRLDLMAQHDSSPNQKAASANFLPEAGAVFSAAIKAMGGEEALVKIRSIHAVADCTGPRSKYKTELVSARADRLMFKQSWSGREPFLAFVNGRYAWTKNERTGEVAPLDKKSVAVIRSHEFQMIAIALQDRYRSPRVEGYEAFGGARCLKIRVIDELDHPCYIFFHTDSHLMAGMLVTNPQSVDETIKVVFNRWSRVGGVSLPSMVTATDKTGDFVLNFYDIDLNRAETSIFKVPREIAVQVK